MAEEWVGSVVIYGKGWVLGGKVQWGLRGLEERERNVEVMSKRIN